MKATKLMKVYTPTHIPLLPLRHCLGSSRTRGYPWRQIVAGRSPGDTRRETEHLAGDAAGCAWEQWHCADPTSGEEGRSEGEDKRYEQGQGKGKEEGR